jgi:glucose/arabinose dehydrogenase
MTWLFASGLIVATAQSQTLYVSVNSGGTIQQVTSGGATTFASGLQHPTGLAFGPDGNLYVSQDVSGSLTSLVSKVTVPGGSVTTFVSGLQLPLGLAFNGTGDLFIASYNTPVAVLKVLSGGSTATTFTTGSNSPFGVAINGSGILFVANRDSGTVTQINMSDGTSSTFASGFNQPNDLEFAANGDLFVSNFGSGDISKVTPGGTVTTFATGFSSPVGLAFDAVSGALFVAAQGTGSIYELTNLTGATGSVSTFATGLGGVQYLAAAPGSVPEPATYAMLAGLGALGVAIWRRRAARRVAQ